jgi:hypothetical protein
MCKNNKNAQKRVLYQGMSFNCQLRPLKANSASESTSLTSIFCPFTPDTVTDAGSGNRFSFQCFHTDLNAFLLMTLTDAPESTKACALKAKAY